ncbi:MAG: hypothetical protein ACKO6N_20440 [Myxococcota bacterium]
MQGADKRAWESLARALSVWEQHRPRTLRLGLRGGSAERATELVYEAAQMVADPLLEVTFGLEKVDLLLAPKPARQENLAQALVLLKHLQARASEAGLNLLEGQCWRRILLCRTQGGRLDEAEQVALKWQATVQADSSPGMRAEVQGWVTFLLNWNRPQASSPWGALVQVRTLLRSENLCALEARFWRLEGLLRLRKGQPDLALECLKEARQLLESIEDAEGLAWVALEECLLLEAHLCPWQAWQAARESRRWQKSAFAPVELEELGHYALRWPLWRVLWMVMVLTLKGQGRRELEGGREDAQR